MSSSGQGGYRTSSRNLHAIERTKRCWKKSASSFSINSAEQRGARLLQCAMTCLYLALSVFVATSVAIGIVAASGQKYTWVPIPLGLAGAGLLFCASLLLIAESRIALAAVDEEMDFALQLGQPHAPAEPLPRGEVKS